MLNGSHTPYCNEGQHYLVRELPANNYIPWMILDKGTTLFKTVTFLDILANAINKWEHTCPSHIHCTYTYACMHVHTHTKHARTYACTHTHTKHACMHACTHTQKHTRNIDTRNIDTRNIHTRNINTHMYACMHAHTHARTHAHNNIYVIQRESLPNFIRMHTVTHAHTHEHTRMHTRITFLFSLSPFTHTSVLKGKTKSMFGSYGINRVNKK